MHIIHSSKVVDFQSLSTICIEDIRTSNMIKNVKLSRAIQEMCWYKFKSMLE